MELLYQLSYVGRILYVLRTLADDLFRRGTGVVENFLPHLWLTAGLSCSPLLDLFITMELLYQLSYNGIK